MPGIVTAWAGCSGERRRASGMAIGCRRFGGLISTLGALSGSWRTPQEGKTMTDDVTSYLRNLSDYELMKLLHKARPGKYPNPDTDPDLQADRAERIDGDDDER